MAVVEDIVSNPLADGVTLHRHTSILATRSRSSSTSANLTMITLAMKVSVIIVAFFFNYVICEETTQMNPQPPIHYISNVPYISLNTTVFKIVEDLYDQNPSFVVGARNYVLRINPSLGITDSNKNGPLFDNPKCSPLEITMKKCQSVHQRDQDNYIIIIHYDTIPTPKVISCGTVRQGMCTIFHANKLKTGGFLGNPDEAKNYVASITSKQYTLAFPVSGNRSSTAYMTGHEYDDRPIQFSPPALSLRRIQVIPAPAFHYMHQNNRSNLHSSIEIDPQYKSSYRIKFVYGFHDDKYIYIVSNQKSSLTSSDLDARIGRICINDHTLRSYTEIIVSCESGPSKSHTAAYGTRTYNYATAAFAGTPGPDLSSALNATGQFLFIALSYTKSRQMDTIQYEYGSVVCGISLEKLNQKFDHVTEQCFMGSKDVELHPAFNKAIGGPIPCSPHRVDPKANCGESTVNPYIFSIAPVSLEPLLHLDKRAHITALVTYNEKSSTVSLIGTSKGQIIKALLASKSEVLFEKDFASQNNTPELEKQIRPDPVLNKDKSYAMFLVSDRIIKFPTNSCAIYSSCATCIQSKDPLGCGWCDGKCGSVNECPTTPSQTCSPVIYSFSPKSGPKEGGTQITIQGDNFGHSQSGTDPINVTIIEKGASSGSAKSKTCDVTAWGNAKITCITQPTNNFVIGNIQVKVKDHSRKVGNYDIEGTVRSKEEFEFRDPNVNNIQPLFGPFSGGVNISISGNNLDTGNKKEVLIVDPVNKTTLTQCKITLSDEQLILCETEKYSGNVTNGSIVVKFDNRQITTDKYFIFKKDPVITDVFPTALTVSSEMKIKVSGLNLDSIAVPILKFENQSIKCNLIGQYIICQMPKIDQSWGDPRHDKQRVPFAIYNDGSRVKRQSDKLQFSFYPDPKIYPLSQSDQVFLDDHILELRGANLSTEYPINITVGHDDFYCKPLTCDQNRLRCEIQFGKTLPSPDDVLNVRYTIGRTEESLGEVIFKKRVHSGVSPLWIVLLCVLAVLCVGLLSFYLVKKSKKKEKDGLVIFTNQDQSRLSNGKYFYNALCAKLRTIKLASIRARVLIVK